MPTSHNIKTIITQQLRYARSSVYVAVACFNNHDLFDILCYLCQQHGIKVSLLITQHNLNTASGINYQQLNALGGRFYCIDTLGAHKRMLNKFCVIDEKTSIIGSYNFTNTADNRHDSILVLENDPHTALELIAHFEQLVSSAQPPESPNFNQTITTYTDPDIALLQLQIRSLEAFIGQLEADKGTAEQLLYRFNHAYFVHLGELIAQILAYRLKISQYLQQQQPSEPHQQQYEQARRQYEHFNEGFEANKQVHIANLNEEDTLSLKALYRKAVMLCHPDRYATEAEKNAANEWFVQLAEAYHKNNLAKVQELYTALQSQNFAALAAQNTNTNTNATAQKATLEARLAFLQNLYQQLLADLAQMYQTESYQIATQTVWDTYFAQQKTLLQQQLQQLIEQWKIYQNK